MTHEDNTEPSALQLASLEELANEILSRCATVVVWVETVSGPTQTTATSWFKGTPASIVGACSLLRREALGVADMTLYGGGDES